MDEVDAVAGWIANAPKGVLICFGEKTKRNNSFSNLGFGISDFEGNFERGMWRRGNFLMCEEALAFYHYRGKIGYFKRFQKNSTKISTFLSENWRITNAPYGGTGLDRRYHYRGKIL
jgi:hypothetical protein